MLNQKILIRTFLSKMVRYNIISIMTKLMHFVHFFLCKQIWLGGTPNQSTLAKCFMDKVKIQALEKVLEPLFYSWKIECQLGESFGLFTTRIVSAIQFLQPSCVLLVWLLGILFIIITVIIWCNNI